MTTVYNPMTNGNDMSHSNQIRQLYGLHAINNSQAHQQLQQRQIQQHQQQQQQIMTTPQTQQSYRRQPVYGRFTNTQQRNTLRNVGTIGITISTEIIDLSTPPSSPVHSTVQETSVHPNVGWEFTRIPNQMWTQSTLSSAYKVKIIIFINCHHKKL